MGLKWVSISRVSTFHVYFVRFPMSQSAGEDLNFWERRGRDGYMSTPPRGQFNMVRQRTSFRSKGDQLESAVVRQAPRRTDTSRWLT